MHGASNSPGNFQPDRIMIFAPVVPLRANSIFNQHELPAQIHGDLNDDNRDKSTWPIRRLDSKQSHSNCTQDWKRIGHSRNGPDRPVVTAPTITGSRPVWPARTESASPSTTCFATTCPSTTCFATTCPSTTCFATTCFATTCFATTCAAACSDAKSADF